MRRSGKLPKDGSGDAAIPSNVITRSLGPHDVVKVDLEGPFEIQAGDCFLLCSDGLNGPVPENEFGPAMQYLDPPEATQFLIDTANILGGPDNITATVVKILDEVIATDPEEAASIAAAVPQTVAARVHPGLLVSGFLAMLAGFVIYLALESGIMGGGVALLGLLALLAGLIYPSMKSQPERTRIPEGERFGKGPYTSCKSTLDKKLLDSIVDRCNELRLVSETTNLEVDWSTFDEYCLAGAEHNQDNAMQQAYVQYARAISYIMKCFRNTGGVGPGLSKD
jgi:protein phosphatase